MWLTADDVAARYGVPIPTLYAWRQKQYGPQAVKIGRFLRYHSEDVARFEERLRSEAATA